METWSKLKSGTFASHSKCRELAFCVTLAAQHNCPIKTEGIFRKVFHLIPWSLWGAEKLICFRAGSDGNGNV